MQKKLLLCMKLTGFMLLVCSMQVAAAGFSQVVTLSEQNAGLVRIFKQIHKQTGYEFVYISQMLENAKRVSINVKNAPLKWVLDSCLSGQPVTYSIKNKIIVLVKKEPVIASRPSDLTDNVPLSIPIRGRITGAEGGALAGASILIKGSKNSTSTNSEGMFNLTVNIGDILLISYVGHETKEVKVTSSMVSGSNLLTISLKQVVKEEEEITVAYNTTTQRRNTGSVTVVKGEQIQNLPNRSFDKSLQGLVPGLLVTSGTGQPGGGLSNFVLRGIGTNANPEKGSTVRNPLIVVDGVPVSQETTQMYISSASTPISNPLAQLNPSDIESITVLKDAAAIALYGANSSNGVIVVTTKKGKPGKTKFGFRHQTDITTATQIPDMLNQQEYIELVGETLANTNPYYQDQQKVIDTLKKLFPTRSDGSFYPQADWYGALFTKKAITGSNEISVSGGNEKTVFYVNAEYTKQNGIVKNTSFDRKSFRLNLEHRPVKWLKFGINSILSHSIQNYGASVANENDLRSGNLWIWSLSPLIPIYLENGQYNHQFSNGVQSPHKLNPVAAAEYNYNRNTFYRGLGNLYGEVRLLNNLSLKTNLGFDFSLTEAKEKADPRFPDPGLFGQSGGRVEEQDTRIANLITTNIIQYNKMLGSKHQLGLLAGQEARILNQKGVGVAVTGLTSPYYDQITSPGATIFSQYGYIRKETLLSYFGQLNYSYDNKYFLTGTIRRDGSSRFGEDKRFGTYWSAGAGWIVSSEPFMQSTGKWLDYLKLRGSIGAAGNAGVIDRFTPYTTIRSGIYAGNTSVRPSSNLAGNADVKWENTVSWDVGLETRFWKERIALTADLYSRTTYDLIYTLPLPQLSGFTSIIGNVGTMRNKGAELSLSINLINQRSFGWRLLANWSTNQNKLLKANDDKVQSQLSIIYQQQGKSFNSFYLVRWAGVDPATGAALFIDSMGKPNPNYNAAKPEFVGKAQPDGFGSVTNTFSYKGFELSAMFYYQYGYQIYNFGVRTVNDGSLPFVNETRDALNRWQKPGDQAINPKRLVNNPSGGSYRTTRLLYQGDHIRLQNVSLSYQFPIKIIQYLRLNNLKTYIQGNNLALWAIGKSYIDPAGANVYGAISYSYPIQRSWTIGIQVAF